MIGAGRKIYLDITLLPTDLHVQTMASVIDCVPDEKERGQFEKQIEFYDLDDEEEESAGPASG